MFKSFLRTVLVAFYCSFSSLSWGTVAQDPLYLVVGADPNVLFNMSIETPMGGAAYNDQPGTMAGGNTCGGRDGSDGICYFEDEVYLGYFDPEKCYSYNNGGGYFEPDGATNSDHECSGKFSGNMMNWASMTAMDMFVYTLTGGNRVIDNTGNNAVTVVKRAKRQNNDNWYPRKLLKSDKNVAPNTVTPWSKSNIYIFNVGKNQNGTNNPSTEQIKFCNRTDCASGGSRVSETYNLHVRVCDTSEGVESNCVSYSNGSYYKPEGLVQSKADHMRFAVTSYLLDANQSRDGGVLRSKMKYVGATKPDGIGGTTTNTAAEINTDGTYISDPDSLAGGSGVDYSGVINYINKFSEYGYKSYDPIAELYYESIRYFKNLGPTPEYYSGLTNSMKGGFPVITSWDDPIQYSCQKNFIVGINDANPWLDKTLPGTHFTSSSFNGQNISNDYGEPSNPDTDIDVTDLTNTVGDLEGLTGTSQCVGCTSGSCDMSNTNKTLTGLGEVFGTCPWPPKANSYYIAGLAYYANTQDIRTDAGMDGEQNVATFMIDTQEYSASPLTGQMNMLWLAGKYGGFLDTNGNDEPDLASEWDEDGDGEPDNYVLATRPDKMIAALDSSFDEIESRTSAAAAVATNSTRLDTNSKIYQARFASGTWTGDLLAFNLNATTGAVDSIAWQAADLIPPENNRNIISYNDSSNSGVIFEHTNLSTSQKALITSAEVDYIRGDQSNEGVTFRTRDSVLGDIVNSDPVYASDDNFDYYTLEQSGGFATYDDYLVDTDYSWQKGNRTDMLYVGGNDGMLHAFLGDGNESSSCDVTASDCEGEEIFAYIPKSVIADLPNLASLSYSHQYFVDGDTRIGDAFIDFDGSGDRWGTALVGTLAAGGKGIFALDISDPMNFTAADVLWDLDDSDLPELGYTFSQPSIVKLSNGDWGAVFGNGYDSANGYAVLYIVNLETGSLIKSITLEDSTGTNGLSTPITVDTDGDKIPETVYAGDLKGNLWAVNISDSNTNRWESAYKQGSNPKPLFQACTDDPCTDPQPITAKPQVISNSSGDGVLVLFGTGKYFETGDNADLSQIQTFYAISDDSSTVDGRDDLVEQAILYEATTSVTGFTHDLRVTSEYPVDYDVKDGWYMDFDSASYLGERSIFQPIVRGGSVIFVTLIPDTDACSYGGTSFTFELNAVTGGADDSSTIDFNGDGVIDDNDRVRWDSNGDGDITEADEWAPGSAYGSTGGITTSPALITDGSKEHRYSSSTDGTIEKVEGKSSENLGRQSWIQIR